MGTNSKAESQQKNHSHTGTTGERGGSVVEYRIPEREVGGSKPTAAVLCPWARHFTPRKYWLITQEVVAPSRHDWKNVDWDVKPQHKQIIQVQCLVCSVCFCGCTVHCSSGSDKMSISIWFPDRDTKFRWNFLWVCNPYLFIFWL